MWIGYSDANPSETINTNHLPGLSVALVFPYHPFEQILDIPVKQYKDYKERHKAREAYILAAWLEKKCREGLVLSGSVNSHRQLDAAIFGLQLIEEMPNSHVERHFNGYRLFFEGEQIDFAHAVALQYYYFTVCFGILRAGTRMRIKDRNIVVSMDRFPGASQEKINATQGLKFLNFIRNNSEAANGILKDENSIGINSKIDHLISWKLNEAAPLQCGKSHPHFILPDWLVAAATAYNFRNDYINNFKMQKNGTDAAEAMTKLYNQFKKFDLWSLDSMSLQYIKAGNKLWSVPQDARDFIVNRAKQNE